MVRKPRVEFDGAFYHVIVCGNQRQRNFQDDRDRIAYLERIEHYRERYGFRLYAYVLMSNHVHLLLECCEMPGRIGAKYPLNVPRCARQVGTYTAINR